MKKLLYALTFACCLPASGGLYAQCSFTPTVTPNNLILCPNTQDTLWTQSYGSYQWMKDGALITGATNQYYVVDAYTDAGSMFSVIATQAGCTDTSAEVLVDGWAFLPPFTITDGDPLIIDGSGNTILCPGDTVYMILGSPYTQSIQWFNNGVPIAGANNDSLIITQPGNYTVEGAPPTCPSYVQLQGVPVPVILRTPPSLSPDTLRLCPGTSQPLSVPAGADSYQWYKNGAAISGATAPSYTVTAAPGVSYISVTTVTDGCVLSSDSTRVETYTVATPTITLVSGKLVASPGGSVLSNFQWYLNGTAISGATDSTYTPTQSGSYTVKAKHGTCNTESAAFTYTKPNSIGHTGRNDDIVVRPNPAVSVVYIDAPMPVQATLCNVEGRVILQQKNVRSIDISACAPGVYLLRIADNNGMLLRTEKLVKSIR